MKKLLLGALFAFSTLLFAPQAEAKHVCRCTKEYRPVCGANGKTYSNKCMASCSHVAVKCAGKCPCKRPCPVFKVKACPKGCKRAWIKKNGCKFPGPCKCKKRPCPVFKVKACPKGCKRLWIKKNGCKFPGPCKCRKK